jgi:hypothetical protein
MAIVAMTDKVHLGGSWGKTLSFGEDDLEKCLALYSKIKF